MAANRSYLTVDQLINQLIAYALFQYVPACWTKKVTLPRSMNSSNWLSSFPRHYAKYDTNLHFDPLDLAYEFINISLWKPKPIVSVLILYYWRPFRRQLYNWRSRSLLVDETPSGSKIVDIQVKKFDSDKEVRSVAHPRYNIFPRQPTHQENTETKTTETEILAAGGINVFLLRLELRVITNVSGGQAHCFPRSFHWLARLNSCLVDTIACHD